MYIYFIYIYIYISDGQYLKIRLNIIYLKFYFLLKKQTYQYQACITLGNNYCSSATCR